jgi:hypothetical protein
LPRCVFVSSHQLHSARAASLAVELLLSTFAQILFFLHAGLAPLTFFLLSILPHPIMRSRFGGPEKGSKGDLGWESRAGGWD